MARERIVDTMTAPVPLKIDLKEIQQIVEIDMTLVQAKITDQIRRVKELKVTNDEQQVDAVMLLRDIRETKKTVLDTFAPGADQFNKLHKAWTGERARWFGPLEQLDKHVHAATVAYLREKDTAKRERAKAEEAQRAIEAQRRALEAEYDVDPWATPESIPGGTGFVPYIPAPAAAPTAMESLVPGVTITEMPWKPRVDNLDALIIAAALSILREAGYMVSVIDPQGKQLVPPGPPQPELRNYLMADMNNLGAKAIQVGEQISTIVPGVSAYRDISFRVPTGRRG